MLLQELIGSSLNSVMYILGDEILAERILVNGVVVGDFCFCDVIDIENLHRKSDEGCKHWM